MKTGFFILLFITFLMAQPWPAPASQSSLFAPSALERVSEKNPAPPSLSQPQERPAELAPQAPIATDELRSVRRPPAVRGSGDGSASITVDAQGNKTLIIHGDEAAQVLDNRLGGQTQIVLGDDTAGIVVDERGHKTLVVKDQDLVQPKTPPKVESEWAAENKNPHFTAKEQPYWVVEPPQPEQPYFMLTPEEPTDSAPYWTLEKPKPQRAYWLPPVERVEILASEVEPAMPPTPVQTASLTPSENSDNTISYYMYRDEAGVTHLTNMPTDPRYRLFTTVVKVQRGLSGGRSRFTHESLRPIIMRAAAVYNLDPALIAAVIRSESAFDAQAVSWAGAQGLMQLMPATAREMGVRNSFDPVDNIMGGSRYLRLMLNRFGGDLTLTIAAYNCGPERVARLWRVPNIAETQNYVKIVTLNYEKYKLQF